MVANIVSNTPSYYIAHHLQNFANKYQVSFIDFSVLNFDTIFWSVAMGITTIFILWLANQNLKLDIPSRFQCFIEILVESVEEQSKSIGLLNNRSFIAPLILTLFIWIALMNLLDLLPVDLPAYIIKLLGFTKIIDHHRIVPTADLNGTLGISISILIILMFYSIKIKGLSNFIKELISNPFGKHPLMWIPNFTLNIIEYFSKTISLGMRLFGNMYAGELLFLLIALLGSTWHFSINIFILGFLAQILAGTIWGIFHILIVFLQAFIFIMLTLVYIGQTQERH